MAGLFGVLGAAGALAARLVGRRADRTSPRANAGLMLAVALAGFGALAMTGHRLVGLVAGVLLLDVGVQGNHVANLARVHGRRPEARSRMNTVYMVTYFVGGSLGTAVGTWAWTGYGWTGVAPPGRGSSWRRSGYGRRGGLPPLRGGLSPAVQIRRHDQPARIRRASDDRRAEEQVRRTRPCSSRRW